MIDLFTKSFGGIQRYLLDKCTHEPSLVIANDVLQGLYFRLQQDLVSEGLSGELAENIRNHLSLSGIVGAISLDLVSAKEPPATDIVVDGRLQGALRHDRMAWYLEGIPLQISDVHRREVDQLLTELKSALVRQPSALHQDVKRWRAHNIAQGVHLLMVSALCDQVRPVYFAQSWLEISTRATIYGPIPQGAYHLWRVYV